MEILGTNLGNWLVLEKWMDPAMFEGTDACDETILNRVMDRQELAERMREHRETYVTKADFEFLADQGVNTVRIPVPYFIFGDREPYNGCVEYLDRAFDWAEETGIKILVDLHTAPGGQNGYDNGGIQGVCKFGQDPKEVRFVLSVLTRLAERYKDREGLFGIEVLNEPISFPVWMTSHSRKRSYVKEEHKGSWSVPTPFLKKFYLAAYKKLRAILPEEKAIVFHDGFRMDIWNGFFDRHQMVNVYLDVHIYIFAMEKILPLHHPLVYKAYMEMDRLRLRHAMKSVRVLVGEWCVCTQQPFAAYDSSKSVAAVQAEMDARFAKVFAMQMDVWRETSGFFYWNYQLVKDTEAPLDTIWKEAWDLRRCWKHGWVPAFKTLQK